MSTNLFVGEQGAPHRLGIRFDIIERHDGDFLGRARVLVDDFGNFIGHGGLFLFGPAFDQINMDDGYFRGSFLRAVV